MPRTPRSTAILWSTTVAFLFDIASMGIYMALIIPHGHNARWYHILAFIFMPIAAVGAAYNAWRWWRIHQAQTRAAAILFYPVVPSPLVGVR
ncbi:hypothetical protein C8R44DRAFT_809735 [Mycena epipterygia]|nr:hypothetical protein C8R44DRAFT_826519 [Mycena epipterygia]KAJ7100354.1 hypothetical protein C8R44DRAFT_809735 [Mycena epipterygia]